MALAIDTTRALRGMNDLRRLVEAIVAGTEHDEADWLEWKSVLDLSAKEGCFAIARTVLGLANRPPERANLMCEGLGYLVVGAEPGSLLGITSVDPATTSQLIEPYLGGADGPRWTPTSVDVGGKTVLVVTVEAPNPGDRIFTLRREHGKSLNGAVFVRKHGRTVPADAADMDALQRRLTAVGNAGGVALEVNLVGDVPLSWFDASGCPEAVRLWVAEYRDALVAQARTLERSRSAPKPTPTFKEPGSAGLPGAVSAALAARQQAMYQTLRLSGSMLGEEDDRTLEQYIGQVDQWHDKMVKAASDSVPALYAGQGYGVTELEVINRGSRFLPNVAVEVTFEFAPAVALTEKPKAMVLPRPPRRYGDRKPSPMLDIVRGGVSVPMASVLRDFPRPALRTWVRKGSVVIGFSIGDLRQLATDTSDPVHLLLGARPVDGIFRGTWTASIRDVDGLIYGELEVPVAESPVDVGVLLQQKAKARPKDA